MPKMIYSGGDMLKLGSQLMKNKENEELTELGFKVYSPQDDKEINDKTNQTKESNDKLAEKIFAKDTKGILESDILIFEVDNNNVGTTTEVGQCAQKELEHLLSIQHLHADLHNLSLHELTTFPGREKYFLKKYFFHSYDVRRTNIPEEGDRRSWSLNQYLNGALQFLNPNGIMSWDEIKDELKTLR